MGEVRFVIDGTTLFAGTAGLVAGIAGGRARQPRIWRDAYDGERVRNEQLSERILVAEKDKSELSAELTAIRARPDMTRLAGMIDVSMKASTSEHHEMIHSLHTISQTLDSIRDRLAG